MSELRDLMQHTGHLFPTDVSGLAARARSQGSRTRRRTHLVPVGVAMAVTTVALAATASAQVMSRRSPDAALATGAPAGASLAEAIVAVVPGRVSRVRTSTQASSAGSPSGFSSLLFAPAARQGVGRVTLEYAAPIRAVEPGSSPVLATCRTGDTLSRVAVLPDGSQVCTTVVSGVGRARLVRASRVVGGVVETVTAYGARGGVGTVTPGRPVLTTGQLLQVIALLSPPGGPRS